MSPILFALTEIDNFTITQCCLFYRHQSILIILPVLLHKVNYSILSTLIEIDSATYSIQEVASFWMIARYIYYYESTHMYVYALYVYMYTCIYIHISIYKYIYTYNPYINTYIHTIVFLVFSSHKNCESREVWRNVIQM